MGAPLRDGSWITLEKVRMRVVEIQDKDVVLYAPSPAGAGTTRRVSLHEARQLLETGTLVPDRARSILGWGEQATDEMIRRRVYCNACDELFETHKGELGWAKRPKDGYARIAELTARRLHAAKAKALGKPSREVAFVPPPGGSTLRAWHSGWIKAGRDDEALVPRHDLKGSTKARLSPEVRTIVKKAVQERYLVQERPPVSAVFDTVEDAVNAARRRAGDDAAVLDRLKLPHIETLRRFIARTVTDYEATLKRQGPKAASSLHRRGRPFETVPLLVAETDSTPLDLFVVLGKDDYGFDHAKAEAGKKQVARPHLTVILDIATRMVLGFHIGFEAPSWSAVMNCLLHAIRPKAVDGCSPGAIWPVQGAPAVLRYDGGSENDFLLDDQATKSLLDMMMIKCPAGQPKTKAYVERFIGTANRDFTANLPGKSFSNPKERGEYAAETHATLTLDEVRRRFLIWVVDRYHNEPHRGSGMLERTPLKVWQEFERQLRAPPNVSDDDLVACLSVVVKNKITASGIEFEGLRYSSPKLLRLGQEQTAVKIRLDPRDLTQVLVLPIRSRTWMRVPKSDGNPPIADTLNLAQWKAYRTGKKKKGAPTAEQKEASASARTRIAQGTVPTRVKGSKDIDKSFSKIDGDAMLHATG